MNNFNINNYSQNQNISSLAEADINNTCYNCSDCPSLIEILSINKNTNIIKFKCTNEKIIKEMPLKEYFSKMLRYRNEHIIDDKCQYHNKKYNFFCFECNKHLCEQCLRMNNHIIHNKIYINEVQPKQEDLNNMKEIIKNYKNQIEILEQKLINKPKELKIIQQNKKCELYQKMSEKIARNKLIEEENLNLIKNKFLLDIDEIRKRYKKKLKERKNQFKIDEHKIKKKI